METTTNKNYIQAEVKNILKRGVTCPHSAQSLLYSCLMCKIRDIHLHKTTRIPVVSYVYETCTETEERRLTEFENNMWT
jgi:hypothetical protein